MLPQLEERERAALHYRVKMSAGLAGVVQLVGVGGSRSTCVRGDGRRLQVMVCDSRADDNMAGTGRASAAERSEHGAR